MMASKTAWKVISIPTLEEIMDTKLEQLFYVALGSALAVKEKLEKFLAIFSGYTQSIASNLHRNYQPQCLATQKTLILIV